MEESVFNINPSEIKLLKKENNYNYTFLDDIIDIEYQNYYHLINSLEDFQLKNIYNFLYLRSLHLNRKLNTKILNLNKYIENPEILNQELNDYIHKEKLYAIILINGIQLYFYPKITQ